MVVVPVFDPMLYPVMQDLDRVWTTQGTQFECDCSEWLCCLSKLTHCMFSVKAFACALCHAVAGHGMHQPLT